MTIRKRHLQQTSETGASYRTRPGKPAVPGSLMAGLPARPPTPPTPPAHRRGPTGPRPPKPPEDATPRVLKPLTRQQARAIHKPVVKPAVRSTGKDEQ